jgi:serine/threonine-protein kinase
MEKKLVQKIGKYEIVAELGQGGMGVVYKARDPFIGRLVALKTITPELVTEPEILKRFYREAQSAGTLQHPNIVTIYDLGEADGRPYIAMEFVEGESLQSIINRKARIPLAAKLKLVQQFCEGLDHAHKHGFVHRDVKPANILVTNDGIVKVVDFGIVHLESTNLTKTGMFLGTIHYASPEQINDGRVDSRSDLWSVTCVVYEFIAYKKAFDGSNIAAIIAKVLSAEPEPLSRCCPGVPAELDGVISRGLKKNIEERYQSLDEMLGGLLPIARGLQQSFIGDLLLEAKDLRDKGDFTGAHEKVRAVLILDNTHADAKRLSSEIASELHKIAPITKAKRLVTEAEHAFSRGDYGEAARMLGEAQELNPADTQAPALREKALREQIRVQGLRETLNSGVRALKEGDLTGAEQEFHQVIQQDPNNPQAAEYLEKIRQDRLARERDFRLKESFVEPDKLVSDGKYEEAQGRLQELQRDFPNSEVIARKLQALEPFIRSRKLFQEGERALNQGEFAEAVRALAEALELNPNYTEASELKERAIRERDRLRQLREALSNGQRAIRQGDPSAAEIEFQKVLQLDPANSQATNLLSQVRQKQAARQREGEFLEALQQCDQLVAEGKFDDAQSALLDLQQKFPDATEIDKKLLALDQQMKLGRLLEGGQQAFDQGEFGEAVRILTEAQELSPGDERVRNLKVRAVQERDRLRQIRDAIGAGQRALRKGDAGAAEREYQRALQLDPTNTQARTLLTQVRKDRPEREPDQRLKEGLSQAEVQLSQKKFDEAQRTLTDLQRDFPDAEEVGQKLQTVSRQKEEAARPAPPPPPPPEPRPRPRVNRTTAVMPGAPPLSDASKSMRLAEELRRSLENTRAGQAGLPVDSPAPALTSKPPGTKPPAPEEMQAAEPDATPPSADAPGATMMGTSLKGQVGAGQRAAGAPPPATPPPAPRVAGPPATQPSAPAPAPPHVEPRKPAPAVAPPRAIPTPAVQAPKKMSPMIMVAVVALVLILGVVGFLIFHNRQPGVTTTTPPPPVPQVQPQGQQEKDLFGQAKAAQEARKWDDAIALYNKVADMNGPLKDQALAAIPVIKQQQQGTDVAKIEKQTFQDATAALKKKQYTQARGLFQQVVELKMPDSQLAQQAQQHVADIDQILKAQEEFDSAERTASRNDLDVAIAQFQKIADGGGPFAARAKARVPELQKMKTELAANAALKQQFDAAVQAENSNQLQDALDKFNAIARNGGTLGSQAQNHIKAINDKLASANAERDWKAALQAENNNDNNAALAQFKAIAAKSGPYKDQAQTHVQTISDKLAAAADLIKFDDAVKKQNSGDLQGALAEFKALAGKSGPKQADALDRFGQVSQLIADAGKPKVEASKPTPAPPAPGPGPAPGPARNPVVTPLSGGEPQPLTLPWRKGMVIPDYNVDGGLQSANLAMPPVPGAPPGSMVLIRITIDENGNVTPNQILNDTSGFGSEVQKAARTWKFKPPTAKGKPVNTSISVRVTF